MNLPANHSITQSFNHSITQSLNLSIPPYLSIILLLLLFLAHPAQAKPPFLVDADWVAERLDDPKLVILEVRYHPHRYTTVGHIPGAIQVQRFRDLGDNSADPIMRFPSREAFQATLRRWGVDDDSTLVLYDDARTTLASRLFFLLDLYGFDMSRVRFLDGGTIEWTVFESLEQRPVVPQPGKVTLKPANRDMYVEWPEVYDRIVSRRDTQVVLVDARPNDQYTGEVINHAIRGGHIPGAINIVGQLATDRETHKWLDDQALAELYESVPKEKTIFVYCHDGFRMSQNYIQLKYLGYQDVRVLNGGWGHWGNALSLPVVDGNKPYDGGYEL